MIALDGGDALVLDGSLLELHDATGASVARIDHGFMDDVAHATSPDGRWVAQVDGDYAVVLFDLRAKKQVARQSPPTKPTAIAVAADGTVFVGQEGGGTLRFSPP